MALVVDLPYEAGWSSHRYSTGPGNPFLEPLYPDYEPPHRHPNVNQGVASGLLNRQDETRNSNPQPTNPSAEQPICNRAAAKAQKASPEAREDEAEQQKRAQGGSQTHGPRIQHPPGERANSESSPQRHSQQASLNLSSPNHGISSTEAWEATPHRSEQTFQTPSASSPHAKKTGTTQPRFDVDNLWDAIEDVVQEMLAKMGLLVPVVHQFALWHATRDINNLPIELKRRPRLQVTNSPCPICLEVPEESPNLRPTSRCTHPSTICAGCLERYISHAIQSQGSTTLTCPYPECRQAMEYADVLRGAKNDQACLDRYETLLLRRTLESERNFVWCKNPTCGWGQVHEGGDAAPIIVCRACSARSCFIHDTPWHTGLTCEQYSARLAGDRRKTEDQASQAYISRHAKVCPNPSCGRCIEKSEGCDHMTCRRPAGCGHEFCWVCLADYNFIRREGNHRHESTCQYYAAIRTRVPVRVPLRLPAPEVPEALRQARQRARPARRVDAEQLPGYTHQPSAAPGRNPDPAPGPLLPYLPLNPPPAPRPPLIRLPPTRPAANPPPTGFPPRVPISASFNLPLSRNSRHSY